MNKIPLESTIGSAYRFLFTRILSILGTLWLPLLVMAVLVMSILYAAVPHEWLAGHLPQIPEHSGQGPHQIDKDMAAFAAVCRQYIGPFLIAMPPIIVLSVVLNAMMMVGLLRQYWSGPHTGSSIAVIASRNRLALTSSVSGGMKGSGPEYFPESFM